MDRYYSTISGTLHFNIEQSYDSLVEQSTETGSIHRVQVSNWKQVSGIACRMYTEEKGFTPPYPYKS